MTLVDMTVVKVNQLQSWGRKGKQLGRGAGPEQKCFIRGKNYRTVFLLRFCNA